jgi:hypothetical protein
MVVEMLGTLVLVLYIMGFTLMATATSLVRHILVVGSLRVETGV